MPEKQPHLIAGRFDTKRVATNLAILALLTGVISFAAVFVADLVIANAAGLPARSPGEAVLAAVLAAAAGVLAGLLYLPVVDTANENLFIWMILSLTIAGLVAWVIFGGLLDQDWQTLGTGVAVLAAGVTAMLAPARIDAAEVQ